MISQAIDLAVEQHKSKSPEWTLEHVSLDGGSDETGEWTARIERDNAEAAASDASVIAYVGPYNSGATKVSLPITGKAGLLQLSPTSTWPGLTQSGWDTGEPEVYYPVGLHFFARLMPTDVAQAQAAAMWAARLGAHSVYAVNDGSTYSLGLTKQFVSAARELGMSTAGESAFVPSQSSKLADNIASSGAEAVFYAPSSVSPILDFIKELGGVKLKAGVFMSDVALNGQVAQAIGSAPQEWRVVYNGTALVPEMPRWSAFKGAFRQRYGVEPSQFAGNAYDLTNLVLDAFEDTGLDRGDIGKAVMSTKGYEGVSGSVTLDEHGDRVGWRIRGYRATNRRFAFEQFLENKPGK